MGKCGKCACRVLKGAELLPEPNWKEKKRLGPGLDEGYRLICQLWISHDVELEQDRIPSEPPSPAVA
jgi:ferredoxin